MIIDHIIIGTDNFDKSVKFYKEILLFLEGDKFIDTGTGVEGVILISNDVNADLKILIVPFEKQRIPNPQHVAFRVEKDEFNSIYERAKSLGLKIRAKPPLNCEEEGIGFLEYNGNRYKNFYILDPAKINIEILLNINEEI